MIRTFCCVQALVWMPLCALAFQPQRVLPLASHAVHDAPYLTTFATAPSESTPMRRHRRRRTQLFSSPQESSSSSSSTITTDAAAAVAAAQEEDEAPQYKKYLATCIPGLASILAEELQTFHDQHQIEVANIQLSGNSAVTFEATRHASLYCLCWLRTTHRLLELIVDGSAHDAMQLYDRHDLYDFCRHELPIRDMMKINGSMDLRTISVKVSSTASSIPSDLTHSHYTALTIKNAIVDYVRENHPHGARPDVDLDDADVPLVCRIRGVETVSEEAAATIAIYRCLHPPGSLHKRGYRQNTAMHKAAMKESLAAGLVLATGLSQKLEAAKGKWQENGDGANESDGESDDDDDDDDDDDTGPEQRQQRQSLKVVDPMCGSGSFLLEALMIATDFAPGLMRMKCGMRGQSHPPAVRWDDSQNADAMWKDILKDAAQRAKRGVQELRRTQYATFHGNDIHAGALDILEDSLAAAGLTEFVEVVQGDCYDLDLELDDDDSVTSRPPYFVITNPPWGVRLTEDITESWDGLRYFLRDTAPPNTEAWVLSGHKSSTSMLKLKRDKMIPIQTGEQDLRWIQYTIRGKPDKTQRQDDEDGDPSKEGASLADAPQRVFREKSRMPQETFDSPPPQRRQDYSNNQRDNRNGGSRNGGSRNGGNRNGGSRNGGNWNSKNGNGSNWNRKKQPKKKKKKTYASDSNPKTNEWLI